MTEVLFFGIICLAGVICLLTAVISAIRFAVKRQRRKEVGRTGRTLKKSLMLFGLLCLLGGGLVFWSQQTAATPDISKGEGKEKIAELTAVNLNGREEWISIRGEDRNNPVLLFLAGGPGGSQMAAVRHELGALEKHFTVVVWDQPGAAKSYHAMDIEDITPEVYVEDGYALTNYLRARFDQEKIYLVGESWGSALGIFLIDRAPEMYAALVGTGQMVDFRQTEVIDYQKALRLAEEAGDSKTAERLKVNGRPPYYGMDVTRKSAVYLQYLNKVMGQNEEIHQNGFQTMRDIGSEEYGLWDKINYLRGILNTFNHVYPQLYDVNLRKDYRKVNVPVYFFLGKHDLNAPLALAEEYYELLAAPEKKIVWFEHSGHSPWINESEKFIEELMKIREEHTDD